MAAGKASGAPARPQQQADPAAAGGGGKKGRGKKRKGGAAAAEEQHLPQDEVARRARQRKLRDVALRLRAEGKVYKKHKKHKPRRRVQLIIIPIFWQKKPGEKGVVLEAAERVQELLRNLGVKCDTDTTTELTPGQKYRHWEEKGVMLRVELGPKEAQEGACILARCRTAGEVAEKQTVAVGPQLCERVKQHLEDMGQTLAPPPVAAAAAGAGAAEGEAGAAAQARQGKANKGEQQQEAAAAAAQGQQAAAPKQRGGAQQSAEELEGDFAGVPLLQEQGPGKKGKKREAAAAVKEAEVAAFKGTPLAAGGDAGGSKKKVKKQHKVVSF